MNQKIRAREVFVIGDEGEQLGTMSPEEAIQIAQEDGLDLVEVNPNARPPVCKIMDYGKYLYDKKKQAKGSAPRLDTKEIRVRPKTGTHDVDVKVNRGRKFLEKGHKVQLTMLLRGREKAHPDRAERVLREVAEQLVDISKIEQQPRLNHNRMSMLFAPDKNAISKLVAAREKAEKDAAKNTARSDAEAKADDEDDEDIEDEDVEDEDVEDGELEDEVDGDETPESAEDSSDDTDQSEADEAKD